MGCGNSIWLPYAAKAFNCSVAGIDYSDAGVASARENLQTNNVEGSIYHADFLDDGQMEGFFQGWDVVLSVGVIDHFDQPELVIDKFTKCLKPGGTIITIVPNMCGLMGKIQKHVDADIFNLHQQISQEDLVNSHKSNGLTIIGQGALGFLGFSMLNFSGHGKWTRYIGRAIRFFDLPLLALYKLRLKFSNPYLSSFYYVVAERR